MTIYIFFQKRLYWLEVNFFLGVIVIVTYASLYEISLLYYIFNSYNLLMARESNFISYFNEFFFLMYLRLNPAPRF